MTTNQLARFINRTRSAFGAGIISLACLPAFATTFTNNTAITVGNTNYDGTDIVITNCTVTVDGPHAFSSVRVASGGVLTHSFSPNGSISNLLFVTNEAQVLTGTNLVTLANSNVITTTVSVTDVTGVILYASGLDYLLSSPDGILFQLQRTTNSAIPSGATVLVNYESLLGTLSAGFNLSVAGNVQVDVGGAINADGAGYGGGAGPGAGHSAGSPMDGSGGGYGGNGGTSSSNAVGGLTYGSYALPMNLGSSGGVSYAGVGGAGGGSIQIIAGGSLVVNGSISANGAGGTNSRSGGGSGGSILIAGVTFSGSGTITAKGGAGEPSHGGGGGGGRISLQSGATSFTGSMSACGGAGATIGGAGTIYKKVSGQNGLLIVDNGGQPGINTILSISDSTVKVLIQGNAGVMPSGAWTVGNLTVASNGLLQATTTTMLSLTAAGAITIEAGGAILANGAGYGSLQGGGPGVGHFIGTPPDWTCGGGGYGGNGASGSLSNNIGGSANGVQTSPTGFGSAGGSSTPYSTGGNGGGGIQITSLSGVVQVDGTISANGGNGSGLGGGGGSGGTISLTGGTLLGAGSITAGGGAGANSIGGGGGGGRIFLNPTGNLFAGAISATGGGGGNWGGAGTVVIVSAGKNTQLILDNGGNLGANTPVQVAGPTDLIVQNGAVGSSSSSISFVNLFVNSNGWLAPFYNSSAGPADSVNFTFTGNATIQGGGGIIADFAGSPAGQGTGEGRTGEVGSTNICSGAGHGGFGGNGFENVALGGGTYDVLTSPTQPGSGGGTVSPLSPGGTGGGIVRLNVSGTLEVDGVVSAAGGSGSGISGGGGSGGSIWLSVGALAGAGTIAANGGSGVSALGGGGGGGMIYISCNSNSFSGALTAYGGAGANWGGAGTAIIQAAGKNSQLVLDNSGHPGTATPLPNSVTTDVIMRDGAIGVLSSRITLGNVLIASNAWILATNSSAGLQASSAIIQAGGGIIADGFGSPLGQGTGAGHSVGLSPSYPCSGAGHGGLGGNSLGNVALGGNPYDSQSSPVNPGSGGGTSAPESIGGAGGGVFSVTVTGLLQVDGVISANGLNGTGVGGGGGSGGGIKLVAGTLSGAGSITANGGNGAGTIGGGGAGGCIAINPTVNLFAGTISAYGGGGANWGGAGTIFVQTNVSGGQLILDNGAQSGAATPIQSGSSTIAIILRNGAIAYQQTQPQSFASLLITSNAWLEANPIVGNSSPGIVNFTITGSATIQAGGGIVTDGAGFASNSGTGAGHFNSGPPSFPCSGAGFGGYGANSLGNSSAGGLVYGSVVSPNPTIGSGGGSESPYSIGGAGGGSIRLAVTGVLDASGKISANGANGTGLGGGGGSGGSISISAGTLVGAGAISANGGTGAESIGGGGGGGRIALNCAVDDFVGTVTAQGGGGAAYGGAGTIYSLVTGQSVGQLLVDNGGMAGTNTPVSSSLGLPSLPFNLTIQNGATVCPLSQQSFPLLSNLTVAAGGTLTSVPGPQTLDLLVFNNVEIAPGGVIAVDAEGNGLASGPGGGLSANSDGSGAGYGGVGGASTTVAGGPSYGSASQPVDFGSGGGPGSGAPVGGSHGGGAIRLNVGGILGVDGQLSAEGEEGLEDNSGGGSGGSVWVSAGFLTGNGLVAADGGEGELYGGGGGAGGRIALYSRTNVFFGLTSVTGAVGDFSGGNGTVVISNNLPSLQVLSNTPSGTVSNGVSSVTLYFNDAPNPNSVNTSALSLMTPGGLLSSGSISISRLSSASYLVSFPLQTAIGAYALTVGTNVTDLYGRPLSPAYAGTFTISLPVVQGTVTDTNGHPVAGVMLQPSGGLSSVTTDTNGNYTLGFTPGATFTVTPSQGALVFVPPSLSYTNVSTSVSNQNYLAVSTLALALKGKVSGANFMLNWQALPGVNYQVYSSSNLVNWLPYGGVLSGSNGTVQVAVPVGTGPMQFFSVQSSN